MQNVKKVHLLSGALILSMLLAAGCTPPKHSSPTDGYEGMSYSSSEGNAAGRHAQDGMQIQKKWQDRTREMVLDAAALAKGTPYVYGGSSLSGFDCSGFVRWAYDTVGVDLPRSAREQSKFGKSVDRASLRVGDIVAFRHPKRGYHTGLYVGNDKFIHSPRRRDVVKVSSLTDPYFNGSYLGARRPELPENVDLTQVEKKLLAIKAQKKAIETASLSRKRTADAKKASVSSKTKTSSKKKSVASSKSSKSSTGKATAGKRKTTSSAAATKSSISKKTTSKAKQAKTSTSKSKKSTTAKSSSKK